MKVFILVTLCSIGFGDIISACKDVWDNTCANNEECCSNICTRGDPTWATGVCQPGSGSTSAPAPAPEPSSAGAPTWTEFSNAVTNNDYPSPSVDKYNSFLKLATTTFASYSKLELAMFMAEALWETGGLVYTQELACVQTQCPTEYRTGTDEENSYPGQYYYGRGYLQLSWIYNYKACSLALYNDLRLLSDPDQVGTNEDVAWASAGWYWSANVHNAAGVSQGQFGAATNAINGALECSGAYQDIAQKRFGVYQKVFQAFNVQGTPIENGCYN